MGTLRGWGERGRGEGGGWVRRRSWIICGCLWRALIVEASRVMSSHGPLPETQKAA